METQRHPVGESVDAPTLDPNVRSLASFLFLTVMGVTLTAVGVYILIVGESGLLVLAGVPAKDVWTAGIPLENPACTLFSSIYVLFWGCGFTAGFGIPTIRCAVERVRARRRRI